ncbi:T9SS type A sorting domain-containing protein, partial [Muriicola sp.]
LISGDPDGLNYIAHFRYENPNAQTIYILEGPENRLTGPALYSGELPFMFLPGTGTFTIKFDGNTLKWELTSRDSTHKSSTTSEVNANSNRCDSGSGGSTAFILYPNPVGGVLFIDQDLPELVTLDVFNMYGISMLRTSLDGRSGPVTHQIDMSDYPLGLYFFRFTTRDGALEYRVIKE